MGTGESLKYLDIEVLRGQCGQRMVVLGAAPACDLYAVSFADVLNEDSATGYQRPFDSRHSRSFRSYIDGPGATTIPLTFNLRGQPGHVWQLKEIAGRTTLSVRIPARGEPMPLAQVDCQHRLGMMHDSPLPLTFQCFLSLTKREEMEVFNVINGKAKGLSSSLLDFHETQLSSDLAKEKLELYVAMRLNDDPRSVWHGRVKLGGASTQGAQRRVSLRGLQSATRLLLHRSPLGSAKHLSGDEKYEAVRTYWQAVASTWPTQWATPRKHLLTKGVGVTALSLLAADILTAVISRREVPNTQTFLDYLRDLQDTDWANDGMFAGFGGRKGAQELHEFLRTRLFAPELAVMKTR